MSILETLSQELADLANRSAAWIVRVNGRRGPNATGVVWSANRIVTSSRAVHRDSEIEIGLPSGETALARLRGRASGTDLALLEFDQSLQVEPTPWTTEPFPGLALALARDRQGTLLSKVGLLPGEALVHRVAPAPEFLGSPLVSYRGDFLGLHVMADHPTVLPFAKLEKLVSQLEAGQTLEPGFLGLALHQVEQENGQACLVIKVEGPAEEAGLKVGDVVTALNGVRVSNPEQTRELLRARNAGQSVTIDLIRAGQPLQIEVTLASRPEPDFPHQMKRHIRRVIQHFKVHHRHGPPHHHGPPPEEPVC